VTYPVPALQDVITAVESDISTRLPGGDSRLGVNVLSVLARAQAGVANGLYGYIAAVAGNIPYDTCDDQTLARWASIWGVPRKLPTAASGTVPATGSATTSVDIPAGTLLSRSDGVQYQTTVDATLAAGSATLPITCLSVGSGTNLPVGQTLSFVTPIAGVNSTVTVAAAVTGGNDAETVEVWRGRLIARVQSPPMGGALSDYVAWALQVAGVTRAWAYASWMGAGTVGVTFMTDDRTDPIPLAADVAAVQSYIEPLRPAGAGVTYFAPTAQPLDLTIHLSPDSTALRSAVQANIQALITRECAPGSTLLLSHLEGAILAGIGSGDFTLTSPAADVAAAAPADIITFGAITWI
jgi:uncharacterized phage protein gp47/JayE